MSGSPVRTSRASTTAAASSLPEERDEIDEQDIEDVKINAREVSIPAQNAFLHSIIQHYHVDGQDGVLNPVGMLGKNSKRIFISSMASGHAFRTRSVA